MQRGGVAVRCRRSAADLTCGRGTERYGSRPGGSLDGVASFLRALAEMGYFDGQTIIVETRWVSGQYDRLPGLAAELVSPGPALLSRADEVIE
jgi:hypothetical protein